MNLRSNPRRTRGGSFVDLGKPWKKFKIVESAVYEDKDKPYQIKLGDFVTVKVSSVLDGESCSECVGP